MRGDLLQEHLGLIRTRHTLHRVRGIAQAPHGIHSPGLWAYATPISPQAAENIKATLSIKADTDAKPHTATPSEVKPFGGHTKTMTLSAPDQPSPSRS